MKYGPIHSGSVVSTVMVPLSYAERATKMSVADYQIITLPRVRERARKS